jgi:hypothetical protein
MPASPAGRIASRRQAIRASGTSSRRTAGRRTRWTAERTAKQTTGRTAERHPAAATTQPSRQRDRYSPLALEPDDHVTCDSPPPLLAASHMTDPHQRGGETRKWSQPHGCPLSRREADRDLSDATGGRDPRVQSSRRPAVPARACSKRSSSATQPATAPSRRRTRLRLGRWFQWLCAAQASSSIAVTSASHTATRSGSYSPVIVWPRADGCLSWSSRPQSSASRAALAARCGESGRSRRT